MKKETGLACFCAKCYRLSVLLEYFNLFQRKAIGHSANLDGGLSPLVD